MLFAKVAAGLFAFLLVVGCVVAHVVGALYVVRDFPYLRYGKKEPLRYFSFPPRKERDQLK